MRCTLFAALLTSALFVSAAHAQDSAAVVAPLPRWTLSTLLEVVHAGVESWGFGPALSLRRDFADRDRWGVELRAALPAFGTGGAAAVDLAATYTAAFAASFNHHSQQRPESPYAQGLGGD